MTQAIIASLPVTAQFLPSFLENIIDKKIAGLALNLIERLIDWICSRVCCPYISVYRGKFARVHHFRDGQTRLFDASRGKVARIENDSIFLGNQRVFFNPNPNVAIVFSRAAFTNYVIVKDNEQGGDGYQIIEQEISRPGNPKPMEKLWHVSLRNQIPGGILVERPR